MGRSSARGGRGKTRARTAGISALLVALVLPGLGACSSRYKKLSSGGSVTDTLFYDVLGQDRPPSYYYSLVRSSHREKDFCYECAAGDKFLVDKNIDAVQRLGRADFGRLEGLGEVVELCSEVIIEDRSALARSSAATTLTEIGCKIPPYRFTPVPDDGQQLLRLMREVDQVYEARQQRQQCGPVDARYVIDRIRRIGNLTFDEWEVRFYRQAIQFFYGRPYLVDETDPRVRSAIDTALTKRIRALVLVSLQAAVDDKVSQVRIDALKGLKTLADTAAIDVVVQRLRYETNWLVRMEAVEYLGKVGTRKGVQALVPMLDDPNASVRHKAREGLIRVAGQDFGFRRQSWEYWARGKDPTITFEDAGEEGEAGGEILGALGAGQGGP